MAISYFDLVEQTYEWPNLDFDLTEDETRLLFHGLDLSEVVKKYGSPLRITYLPKIASQIHKARFFFSKAIDELGYKGNYRYAYCTKSSHFAFVMEKVLAAGADIEISSEYDLDLLALLDRQGRIPPQTMIIANGYKTESYARKIGRFMATRPYRLIPVLDSFNEIKLLKKHIKGPFEVGIRIAVDEEPTEEFYTSRFGLRPKNIIQFYRRRIKNDPQVTLTMLHFFIHSGIKDTTYYWTELASWTDLYCSLKKEAPTLSMFNIGGGLPVPNSLAFEYDYEYMIREIVDNIKYMCEERKVPTPNLITEFGSFTVAESGVHIFSVLGEKVQNDAEVWYILNNSLITTLPDTWAIGQRFILMPLNHWDRPYQRVNLGGITCDHLDYYNSEVHLNHIFLPTLPSSGDPLHIGFFYTGAYQESLSGYGGVKHCLIPSPPHLLIDKTAEGELVFRMFRPSPSPAQMLEILGYQVDQECRDCT